MALCINLLLYNFMDERVNYYYGSERSPGKQQEFLNHLMMMCIASNKDINKLIGMRNSHERTVCSILRILGIVENDHRNFNNRIWLENYTVPKIIFSTCSTLHLF